VSASHDRKFFDTFLLVLGILVGDAVRAGGVRERGRCAACLWKPVCGGNLRSRAAIVHGDPWMPDPACYLTNDERRKDTACPVEISLKESQREEEAA
jgi:hypothetical protein